MYFLIVLNFLVDGLGRMDGLFFCEMCFVMNICYLLFVLIVVLLVFGLYVEEVKLVDNVLKFVYGMLFKYGDKVIFLLCCDWSYVVMEDVLLDYVVMMVLNSVGLVVEKKFYVELLVVVEGGVLKVLVFNMV